ncbi:MAG: hypothetical protein IMZ57_02245 [Acidobacteria bacterium]|nr:hypothetical protein [Acidobacteriota bacterium]
MNAEITPLPWKVKGGNIGLISTKDGQEVGKTFVGPLRKLPAEANAEYIVKAVNNHAALLDALKALTQLYVNTAGIAVAGRTVYYHDALAAIAAAE